MTQSPYPWDSAPQPGTLPRIPQSFRQGLMALLGPLALTLVLALGGVVGAVLDIWTGGFAVLFFIPAALFGLILLIVWIKDRFQARQAEAFLASERPLLRWTYTPAEWQAIKEQQWNEEKGDWRTMLGCLTFLFGLVGLLVGLMIAADEAGGEATVWVTSALGGAGIGTAAGALIGLAVAGGNYLAARSAYRQPIPGQVALGSTEIYANGEYFAGEHTRKANAAIIKSVQLERGNPALLTIAVEYRYRARASEEEWHIVVPRRLVDEVEALIPRMAIKSRG